MRQVTDDLALQNDGSVSIVAVPKPFHDHVAIIQNNAIRSWKRLPIAREIILFGGEEGVAEAAEETEVKHFPYLKRDNLGTPLLSDIFRMAEKHARSDWLCYVNTDIILMPEFGAAVQLAISALGSCLIVSRRWNLDIRDQLSFDTQWQQRMRERAVVSAEQFSPYGIDVFVFPKCFFPLVPPFSLGRSAWDNWLIAEARRNGRPVVDVTAPYTVLHQNHSYSGFNSIENIRRSQQGLRNFWLAGDSHFLLAGVDDATHRHKNGEIVPSGRKTVSVIIPHAGSPGHLRHCLRALSHQSYPRTYLEIILVENSDENTSAAVALEFPYVRTTRETKRGPAAARNKGAALSTGEIIAFLDSDCMPSGDCIESAVGAAEKTGFASIIACNIKPEISRAGSGVQWYQAIIYHQQESYVQQNKACITAALIVPRAVWIAAGPFDEDFPEAACEDWEWSTRATSRGIPLTYTDHAVVCHPVRRTWHELREKSRRLARGELRLAEKRSDRKLLEWWPLTQLCTRRFVRNLRIVLWNEEIPRRAKLSTAIVAVWVWLWTLRENRTQLKAVERNRWKLKMSRRKAAGTALMPPEVLGYITRVRR